MSTHAALTILATYAALGYWIVSTELRLRALKRELRELEDKVESRPTNFIPIYPPKSVCFESCSAVQGGCIPEGTLVE